MPIGKSSICNVQNSKVRCPKVSIVVPFYNPGPFFQQCVSSIFSQDYKNLEILFVNDGSVSGTVPNLTLEVRKKVNVIEQSHRGVSVARNLGLTYATGDYVCFLDSDDFFDKNFISELVRSALEHDSDVVVCDFYYYNQIKQIDQKKKVPIDLLNMTLIGENLKSNIFDISPNVWNKMFKRSLITENQIAFQELKTCNDFAFTYQCLAYAKKISLVNIPLVHYRICQDGNISSKRGAHAQNLFCALKFLQQKLTEKKLFEVYCYTFKLRAFRSIVHEFVACDFFQKWSFLFSATKEFSIRELLEVFAVGIYQTVVDLKKKLHNK